MLNKISTILFFTFAILSAITCFAGLSFALFGSITIANLPIITLTCMILMAIFGVIMVGTTR